MIHPQEIALVRKGSTGVVIMTAEGNKLKTEAEQLGAGYCAAFNEQMNRQHQALVEGDNAKAE